MYGSKQLLCRSIHVDAMLPGPHHATVKVNLLVIVHDITAQAEASLAWQVWIHVLCETGLMQQAGILACWSMKGVVISLL